MHDGSKVIVALATMAALVAGKVAEMRASLQMTGSDEIDIPEVAFEWRKLVVSGRLRLKFVNGSYR